MEERLAPPLDENELNAISNTLENADDIVSDSPGIWKKIRTYEEAGAYTWVVPDLFGGKDYTVGVMIIGGGGSGGAAVAGTDGNNNSSCASGGASGFTNYFSRTVTPGQTFNLIVGSGGVRKTVSRATPVTTYSGVNGEAGGSSSFDGKIANGGNGGKYSRDEYYNTGAIGGQSSQYSYKYQAGFGGSLAKYDRYEYAQVDQILVNGGLYYLACYNPFEQKRILASGGNGYVTASPLAANMSAGGVDPVTGKKAGGDGSASSYATALNASDAIDHGCGGGGAALGTTGLTATSGAGKDGAVYIYAMKSIG